VASAGHTIARVEAFVLVGDKDYATDAGLATLAQGSARSASPPARWVTQAISTSAYIHPRHKPVSLD